jgi:DNA-binding NarL/FixJ family response regulator
MSTKVLLVDDHKIFREGLRSLLEKRPGIEIVGEAENAVTAMRMVDELSPDVVIMDIAMPDMNGIEATRKIIDKPSSRVKVIGLTMHSDMHYVIQMMKAGASGFLLKDCSCQELVEAINAVRTDQIYISQNFTGNLVSDYIQYLKQDKFPIGSALTVREREVLQLIAEGQTIRDIASLLRLSPKTIEAHRQNIMKKLKINNTAELVKYAIREGLTRI